jgi:hypothetical protein
MINTNFKDSFCGLGNFNLGLDTSSKEKDILIMEHQENVINGLENAMKTVYDEGKQIIENERRVFGNKNESEILTGYVCGMEPNYRVLRNNFAFANGCVAVTSHYETSMEIQKQKRELGTNSITEIEHEKMESNIFVKMPPIKRIVKKAKVRRIRRAVPNIMLEEE